MCLGPNPVRSSVNSDLSGKTIVMSGGSRGIGLAIATRAAADGANIVLIAKTDQPDARLNGTIHTAAEAIREAGGHALPIVGDIRSDETIAHAVASAVDAFGGIDICVNNASVLNLAGTLDLDPRRFDLTHSVNTRGTLMLTRACLPHLLLADNPHVVTLSPPLNLRAHWLGAHPGYMLSKYGMTLATLGIAAEFSESRLAANCLWPRTTIATDAVQNLLGGSEALRNARTPQIVADAFHIIVTGQGRRRSGMTLIDEDVLEGITDAELDRYSFAGRPGELTLDIFVD
jgi:citronellol/citronellal dehydrogenase